MAEPITLSQAKQHLRVVDNDSEDALIVSYISAARAWVENYTGYVLVRREIIVPYQAWGDYLTVWHRPVVSVDQIDYVDGDAEAQEFADYAYAAGQYPLQIHATAGFPTVATNSAINVTITAGYAEGEVPEPFIMAIKVLVAGMFLNRGGGYGDAENAAKFLLHDIRPVGMA